ncbi:MAG TPA: transposase [Butyricimonas virosa]|uniref:Transposase n=1 Tax=Butyricimonas virosa TaxID=544645 RepID=A0A921KXS8_9BACT|nr:transposase [Butyricimonas virosa]
MLHGWFFGFKLHLIINDKGEIMLCSYYVYEVVKGESNHNGRINYSRTKNI